MRTKFRIRRIAGEEGSSLVEMAICCLVLMPLMFGVIEFSLGMYAYHFISEAAREGSRYAMVRGSKSCSNAPSLDNACTVLDSSTGQTGASGDNIKSYVKSLGFPFANQLSVSTTWRSYSADLNGHATWTACGSACNIPGNQVQVTVTDSFPIAVPYWKKVTIPLSSSSTMVISQ